jgi:hypothetical protein
MPPFLVLLATISTIQTDAFVADKSGRSRRGFAPARIEPQGGGSGLRACLDDAGVLPESRYIRKEKMLAAHIFPAGVAQVLQSVTRFGSIGRCSYADREAQTSSQRCRALAAPVGPQHRSGDRIGSDCLKSEQNRQGFPHYTCENCAALTETSADAR